MTEKLKLSNAFTQFCKRVEGNQKEGFRGLLSLIKKDQNNIYLEGSKADKKQLLLVQFAKDYTEIKHQLKNNTISFKNALQQLTQKAKEINECSHNKDKIMRGKVTKETDAMIEITKKLGMRQ